MQFEDDDVSGLVMTSCALFILLAILLFSTFSKAEPVFFTSLEQRVIEHAEFGGKLFVDAEHFATYRDRKPATIFEPGTGEVLLVANRSGAWAYLVSREILYVIQHQTFNPAALAEIE